MKKMVCEMCGGNDLIKQDGYYVCQSCGTKFSPEDAKKLMVDISGSTVKIDTKEEIENLILLARRADEQGDSENVIKYYDEVLKKQPNNIEA